MSANLRGGRLSATFLLVAAPAALATLMAAACSGPSAPTSAPGESYAMRGEIVRLPAAGEQEITVRHEAVPGFRDDRGRVVGMEGMTMPFALAPGVALDGFAAGDRVAFTLEMRWQETVDIARITRLERLPDGARLAWDEPLSGAAAPAAGAPAASPPR